MYNEKNHSYLDGQLLIATPSMTDPRFEKAVILVCVHNAEGAMGIIINKLFADIDFKKLISELNITSTEHTGKLDIHFGGPVEIGYGFVLHSKETIFEGSLPINDQISLNTSIDMIRMLATGNGPENALLALGYTGWGAGQLEEELIQNSWLHAPYDKTLVFCADIKDKWHAALSSIGVELSTLSDSIGRA
jgi:putative transcriptional regulator